MAPELSSSKKLNASFIAAEREVFISSVARAVASVSLCFFEGLLDREREADKRSSALLNSRSSSSSLSSSRFFLLLEGFGGDLANFVFFFLSLLFSLSLSPASSSSSSPSSSAFSSPSSSSSSALFFLLKSFLLANLAADKLRAKFRFTADLTKSLHLISSTAFLSFLNKLVIWPSDKMMPR